jgi:hypothetical protein
MHKLFIRRIFAMKKLTHNGYLLFCRTWTLTSNSNETKIELDQYIDKIVGFFESNSSAVVMAKRIMKDEIANAKGDESLKVREFIVTEEMISNYEFDDNGYLSDKKDTVYPFMQTKTKVKNNKKTIIEKSVYIVDCNHYV